MADYESDQKKKQEMQQQYLAEQQRISQLSPAAIQLNNFQQVDIVKCLQTCGQIPSSALPPLPLTPEQCIAVTSHMLQQFVIRRDYVETQQALAMLMQGGLMNLSPIWHGLYEALYKTLVFQFVNIPFNKVLTKPYLEIEDTPQYTVYKFYYNIGPYSGTLFKQMQEYCVNGIQTGPVLALRQQYGLSNIGIGWNRGQNLLTVIVY